MGEVGAAAGAPASKGPDSAIGRIVGALIFPVRTFAAIAARPTFLAPLELWTGLSFLVSELVLTRTDWRLNCDQRRTDANVMMRTARWYRSRLRRAFIETGAGFWLRRGAPLVVWELETAG